MNEPHPDKYTPFWPVFSCNFWQNKSEGKFLRDGERHSFVSSMQITRIISTFLSLWKMPSQTNRQTTKQGYSWETILFYTLSDYVFSIMTRWYFHVISRFFGTMASQFKCPLLKASTDTQTWKRWCRIFQFTTKFLPETIDHFQTTTSNRNRRLRMKGENLWTCHWNLKN